MNENDGTNLHNMTLQERQNSREIRSKIPKNP